jgi:cobalt/nickel transport system permease protein
MGNKVPAFLLERPSPAAPARDGGKLKMPFIERGVHYLAFVIRTGYIQWENASTDGFFQRIDARIKVLFLLFFILIVSLKKDAGPEVLLGAFIFLLTLAARLNFLNLYKRVFFFGFFFGFLIALPSAFNVITRGEIILPVLHLSQSHVFWIYRIPAVIGITREGAYSVAMLTLRVMNSMALSFFVLYTTPFSEIIRALKVLRVPDTFLMVITLSYKYVFIFAKTVEDMHLAKKSRLARPVSDAEARRWITGRIVFLFRKTQQRCEEIFKAMLGRGFSGNVKIYGGKEFQARDWVAGAAFFLTGVLFLWM